jgi:IMP dehydrogenase
MPDYNIRADIMMKEALSFDDVLLMPQYSEVMSRWVDIEIIQHLRGIGKFNLPIIASPMDTVSEEETAIVMARVGGLAIIHRYNTVEEQAQICRKAIGARGVNQLIGAAVGVGDDLLDRTTALVDEGICLICVDIAHGHHLKMRYALSALRKRYENRIHIMAGNVATMEGFNDLSDWGADSVRVNVGSGSICSTRIQTGHGIPGLHTIMECAKSDRSATMIADGGIRNSGDIVKALAAGADFVMLGSLLAGTNESPGELININGERRKIYRGMASREAQMAWRNRVSSLEGISYSVPYRGTLEEVLNALDTGIRSGLSYSGARSIQELQAKAKFIRQTAAGQIESTTHIRR